MQAGTATRLRMTRMNGNKGYAVFFFPQALEALGEAIKPYLQDGPAGPHVMCDGVDTGGSLVELSLNGAARDGTPVELELMVPTGMVRMIVSAHSDELFGFGPHAMKGVVRKVLAGDAGGPEPSADATPAEQAAPAEDAPASPGRDPAPAAQPDAAATADAAAKP